MLEKMFSRAIAQPFLLAAMTLGTLSLHAQNINRPNKLAPMGIQVNTATGNVFLSRTDIYIPARQLDLDISFAYNSVDHNRNSGYGNGWTFEYNMRYRLDTAGRVILIWGNGREDVYVNSNSNLKAPVGIFDSLVQYSPGKYLLRQNDGIIFYFDNPSHKRLTKMTEPNGNYLQFGYTDSLMTSITNTAGQSVTLTYTNGKLASVTDANAAPVQTYKYEYDGYGNLTKVTDPMGGTNKYTYLVNGPMSSIGDKNDNVANLVYYPGFAAREIITCNSRVGFSYDTTSRTTTVIDFMESGSNQTSTYTYSEKGWLSKLVGSCCGYAMEFTYDNNGNLLTRKDANGNLYKYTYDNRGNYLTITDPLNNVATYSYSSDFSKLTSVVDPMGNTYQLQYDATGNETRLIKPNGLQVNVAYNSNGDLTSYTDEAGNTATVTYDAYGYLQKIQLPLGTEIQAAYNGRGRVQNITDPNGKVYSLHYDSLNRLTKLTDPLGRMESVVYDKAGNIISLKDGKGMITALNYDAANRLVRATNPKGQSRSASYDESNNLVAYTDELGKTTRFTYDSQNRLTGITDALNNQYVLNYDAGGNITSVLHPNGNLVTYTYDALNRIVSGSDDLGKIGSLTYDKNGNITSVTNGQSAVTQYTYDNLNRLTKMSDALGNSRVFTYTALNKIATAKDRNNNTASYSYNALNRLIGMTDPNGNSIGMEYDASGNLTKITDQNGNATLYQYDAANRHVKTTYADGATIDYNFDNNNNLVAKKLTDGSTISYTYDSANRLVIKNLPNGEQLTFSYDAKGRMISAVNAAGAINLSFDDIDRVLSESFNGHTTSYQYNLTNRTASALYPGGTTVTRMFDDRVRLSNLSVNNQNIAGYQYDLNNRLLQKTFSNGVVTNYQYDVLKRLTSISSNKTYLPNLSFQYDHEGNRTVIARSNQPQYSETFSYDAGYRLKTYKQGLLNGNNIASPIVQNNYNYDAVGNRTSAVLNGTSINYTINNVNQYTAQSGLPINYTYDANGNRTYDGFFYSRYSPEGRKLVDSSATQIYRYAYDALNRRVELNSNGLITRYNYAGLEQIEERNAMNLVTGSQVFEGTIKPLMRRCNNGNYFHHSNHLSSTEAMTDSIGSLVEQYRYEDFGKTSFYDASNNSLSGSTLGNRYLYTGQKYDDATGNYAFHFRHYSPLTGSFTQRDPIGYADKMGLYQYVGNNPANYVDVLGLAPCPPQTVTTTQVDQGQQFLNFIDYISSLSSTGSVLKESKNIIVVVLKSDGFGLGSSVLGAVSGASNLAQLIGNYNTNTDAANTDLATGALMSFEGASLPLLVAGGALTAVEAAPVAAGLAAYGLINSASKFATGKSAPEHLYPISDAIGEGLSTEFYEKPMYNETYGWILQTQGYERAEQYARTYQRMSQRRQQVPGGENCPPNGPTPGNQNPLPPPPGQTGKSEVIFDKDPNAILGPDGIGEKRWVSVNDRLPYTILFENAKEATAPVKVAKIFSPIDPKLDINTFQLGGFGFNNFTFNVPSNTNAYYQRLDVRDSLGVYVDVTAGIDAVAKQAFWIFETIDPVTLLPTTEPLKGFLLTQDSLKNTSGHGFVDFSIKPIANAATGDTTSPYADIIFGSNDTIPTNRHRNTIDALPPVSSLAGLPSLTPDTDIQLHLSGSDDPGGSGIKWYSIYVSDNNGPLQLLVENFSATDTTFKGIAEHQYRFYIAATDSVGNKEQPKLAGVVNISDGEEVICPGGTTTLSSAPGATVYQWQVNDGSGYVNLAEGGVYAGTATANLTLTNAPSSLYGLRYRTVVDGVPSATEYLLKFAMRWNGTVDNAWENAANWSCNVVPDINTDVIIEGGKDRYPQVNSNAAVRTLRTSTGASVTVKSGFNLTVAK